MCGNWAVMLELKLLFKCQIKVLSEPRMAVVGGDKALTPCLQFEDVNCTFLRGLVGTSA